MILIADSGSSKTLWVVRYKGMDLFLRKTIGLNPNFTPEYLVEKTIGNLIKESGLKKKIRKVFFYGSGCANPRGQKEIASILKSFLPGAAIKVESDMLGAAHALCDGKPGIAAILGTGSNICRYDGKKIIEKVPSFGYIFGDHGSGANLGKTLVQGYLDQSLSQKLSRQLETSMKVSPEKIIMEVYRGTSPNRFLASFAPFIEKNKKNPQVKNIIESCFDNFFLKQASQLKETAQLPVHFTGTIAHVFHEELAASARKNGFTAGRIARSPMAGLIKYHKA